MRKTLHLIAIVLCYALGSGPPLAAADKDRDPSSHWQQRFDLFEATARRADVVMAGDSITEFGSWTDLLAGVDVQNRGISGDTVAGVRERIDQIVAAKPRIVFIMIGINDLRRNASAQSVKTEYRLLIDAIPPPIRIIAQSTLYTADPRLNEQVTQVNAFIEDYCRASKRCEYYNLNTSIAPTGALPRAMTFDGLHLTTAAYIKWRDAIAPLIRN